MREVAESYLDRARSEDTRIDWAHEVNESKCLEGQLRQSEETKTHLNSNSELFIGIFCGTWSS